MANYFLSSTLIIAILLFGQFSYGQGNSNHNHNVNVHTTQSASVAVKGGPPVSLSLTAPTEAGSPMLLTATNNNLWLNYSSVTSTSGTNTVSVKASTTLPGVALKVIAGSDAGSGGGSVGTPTSIITLTTSDQVIINSIGTGYTGNGNNKGHNLTYSVAAIAYNLIKYTSSSISIDITYTITNN